jgi:hypothetical protein
MYFISYILNFVPLIGIGPLIISSSYISQQFSTACLLLSDSAIDKGKISKTPSNLYSQGQSLNINPLVGCISWGASVIIWGISTFSQKYPRRKPTVFDFFYNLAGIYMFYIGISSGLELPVLS